MSAKNTSIAPMLMLLLALAGCEVTPATMSTNILPPTKPSVPTKVEDKSPIVEKIAKEVTIRIFSASAPGSGVTISRRGKTYTVLTCRHVIEGIQKANYRVLLPDGKTYSARLKPSPNLKNFDLATIEFDSDSIYQVIELGDSQQLIPDAAVYAAGFPNQHVENPEKIEDTTDWGSKAFRFTGGKVGLISSRSLPDGYSLGYTNEVESGMSGGPVFNDKGQLVGINGRLKYPIQGLDAFTFADGTKPSVEIFQQMEALSWAIPISNYRQIAEK
jgi:serine protease Do